MKTHTINFQPHNISIDVPEGETEYGYLKKLARAGASRKYGSVTAKIKSRLDHELYTIRRLGFSPVFQAKILAKLPGTQA